MQRTADELRTRARELRQKGWKYAAIAKAIGKSVITVKRLCRRVKQKKTEYVLEIQAVPYGWICACGCRDTVSIEAKTGKCVDCYTGNEVRMGRLTQRTKTA